MYKFEEATVKIAKLKQCPVKVTLQTEKLYKDLASTAKSHPERIGPISVAVLGSAQYIVDGHLRARALDEAGHDSAQAHLVLAKEISEVVRLHIELNTHGSINPLGMLDAVYFLKKHGAERFVSKAFLDLSEKMLYPRVRARLDSFLDDACKKYSTVTLPPHVVSWIVGFEKEKDQATAATVILDSLQNAKESRFVFPTPMDLDVISESLKPRETEEKEVIFYEPKEGGKKKHSKVSKKEAENLVRGSSHDSMVQCPCGERLLLNGKTHRVSSVKDDAKNRCIKLEEEGDARPVYAIPDAMLDFLQIGPEDSLMLVKIGSKKELEKFASSIKDGAPLRMLVALAR